MPAISATAPAKIILFGEHAVVYGQPAIAVPVSQVRARAVVTAEPLRSAGIILIQAPDLPLESTLDELGESHPLGFVVRLTMQACGVDYSPACTIRITSTIPIAAGLGSGAAVSVAIIRAFSAFLGRRLPDEKVSDLAYEVDRLYHGTPSGIDNTVIAFGLPVYFVRGRSIQILRLPVPFTMVIGDTGVQSSTAVAVGDVRTGWQCDPGRYETLFEQAGKIARKARELIEHGQPLEMGPLMDENQQVLQAMGVSSPELEQLIWAAKEAGALGAKLSGGGKGGNMIALVEQDRAEDVSRALLANGAVRTIITRVAQTQQD
jgi:mevalonate kinase